MRAVGYPTQPLNFPFKYKVVKAPRGSERCAEGVNTEISRFSNKERIASRATHNNSFRSSEVYSGSRPRWVRDEDDSSDGGDIALLAPAENKGASPALHHMAIDLRPKREKIVQGGKQRQSHHEPDRSERNPVHRKNIEAVHWPFLPAVVENDGHD